MERALARYQRARDRFDALGGDAGDSRARRALETVGLAGRESELAAVLSGGQQNMLGLARAFAAQANFIILDEPGNHLDYRGLAVLEDLMIQFDGAILLVSHNRYQLDRVTSRTLELDEGKLTSYAGNYSAYRSVKLRNAIAQQSDYLANQKRLAGLEALVKRFEQITRVRTDKAWGKRLRARRKQLGREQRDAVEEPQIAGAKMQLELVGQAAHADIALRVSSYHKAYGEVVLFEAAELDVRAGERVALVGTNGSGKSSLLQDVVAQGSWDNPVLRVGPSARIGYCPQKQDVLVAEQSLINTLRDLAPLSRDRAYAILARFLFTWEDMDRLVGELSGGERSRLQLARLMVLEPNFLILDEPTNHLDIVSREAVEEGLESFSGTVLVASHDRYFLERVAERVVWIDERAIHDFPGSSAEFWSAMGQLDESEEMRNLRREKLELEKGIEAAFERRDRRVGTRLGTRLAAVQARLNEIG
jgi:ATP-binding cassette subfamily F protein 3